MLKEEWIDKLIETQNIAKTARFFKIDRSNLFRDIKKAVKSKILIKKEKKYIIGELDKLIVELHGVQLRFPIRSLSYGITDLLESGTIECQSIKRNPKIKPEQTDVSFREIPEFLIRITSQSIIFFQREDYPIRLTRSLKNVEKLKNIIENQAIAKIPFLEKRLMIDLDELDELHVNCDTGHYAFISDMLAKQFVAKNQKLKVYINGELRSLIDLSDGKDKPHMEHLHPKHNTHDAKAWERFTELLDAGQFDADKILEMLRLMAVNQQSLHENKIEADLMLTKIQAQQIKETEEIKEALKSIMKRMGI